MNCSREFPPIPVRVRHSVRLVTGEESTEAGRAGSRRSPGRRLSAAFSDWYAMANLSPGTALIEFRCVRREHGKRSPRVTLTIHEGKWAFCAHEGATSQHDWTPTGGVTVRELLRLPAAGRRAPVRRSRLKRRARRVAAR